MMKLLIGLVAASLGVAAAEKPNVVFIMVDDLGYADLGCYGGEEIATPNVDRLAAEGTRFTDVYAGSPVCAPDVQTTSAPILRSYVLVSLLPRCFCQRSS